MTEFDIIQSYRQAKDKSLQIGILADLTMNSKREIREILAKAGVLEDKDVMPESAKERKASSEEKVKERAKNTVWTSELVDDLKRMYAEGIGVGEISERLGIDKHAVSNKLWAMKKKQNEEAEDAETGMKRTAEKIYIQNLEEMLKSRTDELELLKKEYEELERRAERAELKVVDIEGDSDMKVLRATSVLRGLASFIQEDSFADLRLDIENMVDIALELLRGETANVL